MASVNGKELMTLREELISIIGHNLSDPDVRFGHYISNYLGLLVVVAEIDQKTEKKFVSTLKQATKPRRDILQALSGFLKHQITAEDIIQGISQKLPIPQHIAVFIRQDVDQLLK